MMRPISFRWDAEFVARLDAARGDVPRSRFVRRAVERALGEPDSGDPVGRSPAPAEQPFVPDAAREVYGTHVAPVEQPRRPGPDVAGFRKATQRHLR